MQDLKKLEEIIIKFDADYNNEKSKNIYVGDNISEQHLSEHLKQYDNIENDEKPLLLVNGQKSTMQKLMPFTGFVITDKQIYFSLLKRSFFTSLIPYGPFREPARSILLETVDSFQIGEHDSCFGTNYTGHDMMINDEVLGLVRMGYAITYDEHAITYINSLSKFLYEKKFLNSAPKEFSWQ